MKLLVKEYLQTHSLNELEENFGVKARFDNDQTKFSLNYDQIKVKNGDRLAGQCRGLIFRAKNDKICDANRDEIVGDVEVLAWPLNRFYNLGQDCCDEVDFNDPKLRVFEKLDGTMCILYWDTKKDKWCVATRSIPEADLPLYGDLISHDESLTFSSLFWRAWDETLDSKSKQSLDKSLTYVFELTTPLNRIFVKYDSYSVTLLAVRDTRAGIEFDILNSNYILPDMPRPNLWMNLSSFNLEELIKFTNNANPLKLEGYIVVDSNWNRIKIKNLKWVFASRAKDFLTVSKKNGLKAIIDGTADDVISMIDDKTVSKKLENIQKSLLSYIKEINENYAKFKFIANKDRKKFAKLVMNVSKKHWSGIYFQMLDKDQEDALELLRSLSKNGKLSQNALGLIIKQLA